MVKGIKEHLLNRQTYITKVCISGATVKGFIEVVKNMDDPAPYAKILIHLGTNYIRNDNESTIIDNLKQLGGGGGGGGVPSELSLCDNF